MDTLRGTVESVEVERDERYTTRWGGTPAKIKVAVALEDGLRAYVTTSVGNFTGNFAAGVETFHARKPAPAEYPWIVPATTLGAPLPAVWVGDVLTVRGNVAGPRTSAKGNVYMSVNRATVAGLERPGWGTLVGRPVGAAPQPERPAPPARPPARVEREFLRSRRDDECKHGNVVYRAGDCDRCEAEEAALADANPPYDEGDDLRMLAAELDAEAYQAQYDYVEA